MGLRLIKSENIANSNFLRTLQSGKYRRLVFHVSGTNAGGQSFSASDIKFTLERDGQKVAMNLADLQNIDNYNNGFPTNTSTAGGTLNLFAALDFFLSGDPNNIFNVGIDDTRLQVEWGNAQKVSSGTITVYGETGQGTENYVIKYKNFSGSLPGVDGAETTVSLTDRNITAVYIRTASGMSKVLLKRDDKEEVNASGTALAAFTSYVGKAEAAVTFIYMDLIGSRTPADIVSSKIDLNLIQSGTGTEYNGYYQLIEVNPVKLQDSIASLNVQNEIAAQTYPPVRQVQALANAQMTQIAE